METINVTVTYPMVGDHTPEKWADIVLGFHLQEQDILEYKFITAEGIDVRFAFKMEVPSEITVAELCVSTYNFIEYMLGERDFTVNDLSILTHQKTRSFMVHSHGKSTA